MPAKKKTLSAAQLAAVSRLFGVLSEPNRLTLLQALGEGPLSVNELVEACGLKQANVSKQLAILHHHHLVKRERDGTCIRYEIADPLAFCSATWSAAGSGRTPNAPLPCFIRRFNDGRSDAWRLFPVHGCFAPEPPAARIPLF